MTPFKRPFGDKLLDVIVVNLTDARQEEELESGSPYITLQRKLSKNPLAKCKKKRAKFPKM